MTAKALGFDGITLNSIDGVSDRDFCVELMSAFALIMTHLSRFSEEVILWSSWEFKFVELDDSFTTGSSIMPQKKNPDMAELVRGKTLETYPLEEYKKADELFENDLYDDIDLRNCVEKRISAGGTGAASIEKQLEYVKSFI